VLATCVIVNQFEIASLKNLLLMLVMRFRRCARLVSVISIRRFVPIQPRRRCQTLYREVQMGLEVASVGIRDVILPSA